MKNVVQRASLCFPSPTFFLLRPRLITEPGSDPTSDDLRRPADVAHPQQAGGSPRGSPGGHPGTSPEDGRSPRAALSEHHRQPRQGRHQVHTQPHHQALQPADAQRGHRYAHHRYSMAFHTYNSLCIKFSSRPFILHLKTSSRLLVV